MPEIQVGYIERFDFNDEANRERMSGHPKVGGVYQILRLEDNYHIHIGVGLTKARINGLTLGPELSGNYFDKWSFNVIILDKQNYLDYSLSDEDMEKASQWLDSDHKELRELLERPMNQVVIADVTPEGTFEPINDHEQTKLEEAITRTLAKHLPVTKQLIQAVSENLNMLVFHAPETLEAVNEVMGYLTDEVRFKLAGPPRTPMSEEFLLFSPSKDVAVYNAMNNLEEYIKPPVVGVNDKEPLYKAVAYCLLELQRRRLQDHE